METPSRSAKRPFLVKLLFWILLLHGLNAGIFGLLLFLNPDGSWIKMSASILQSGPFKDFRIPGLLLFLFNGVYTLCIAYSLWKLPRWTWPDAINPFKKYHWVWAGTMAISVILTIWITVQVQFVVYAFIHTFYYIFAAIILLLTLTPAVRG